MNKPQENPTRQRILLTAARLIHRQGYHATGIQQILTEAGVPKGSFYFYFKSKDDLALAMVELFDGFWLARAEEILTPDADPPLVRLRRLYAWFHDYFGEAGCVGGCPVGNLAQEMGDLLPVLADRLSQSIDGMARRVSAVLAEAQARGELAAGLDPGETAYFIVSSWQGALIRMKACKCLDPLDTFDRMVFEGLLRAC